MEGRAYSGSHFHASVHRDVLRHSSRSMSELVMSHSYSRSSGQQMAVVSLQSRIPATECLPRGAGSSYLNECNQDNLPQACPKTHLPDVSRPIILRLNTTSKKSFVSTGRVGRPILSRQSSSSLKQIANSLRTCKKSQFWVVWTHMWTKQL